MAMQLYSTAAMALNLAVAYLYSCVSVVTGYPAIAASTRVVAQLDLPVLCNCCSFQLCLCHLGQIGISWFLVPGLHPRTLIMVCRSEMVIHKL
uniref:Putative secreted protein n=1 Tax=Ixodes ricinus TaxID=34613 RepID=A0A6B0U2G4_IXORI